jgi:hypothetical protein
MARKRAALEFCNDEKDLPEGEFDSLEGPAILSAIRGLKDPGVRVDTVLVCNLFNPNQTYLQHHMGGQPGVRFTLVPIYRKLNGSRNKGPKVVVEDLPFQPPCTPYIAKWQKVFRPTVIVWASTWQDPYAMNTHLNETFVLEM